MEKILTTNNEFINPKLGLAARLGVELFEDTEPVELWPEASREEIQIVIRAIYRQVLGNAYIMESECPETLESQLKQGDMTVREFVRQLAKSQLYRSRFFENCPRYRSIELNFKHLLGRAPESYLETQQHSQILDEIGFDAEIDSYLDSKEYHVAYGEYIVPYYRGYKTLTGKRMVGFTYMFQLLRGAASSDKDIKQNNRIRLNKSILTNSPDTVIPPSQIGLVGGITDVQELLAKVFKTTAKPAQKTSNEEYTTIKSQCQERAEQIKNLQQKKAQLRSQATIGQLQLNKWQYLVAPGSEDTESKSIDPSLMNIPRETSLTEMANLAEKQKQAIATLETEITRLLTVAKIGEKQLNKWRERTFS